MKCVIVIETKTTGPKPNQGNGQTREKSQTTTRASPISPRGKVGIPSSGNRSASQATNQMRISEGTNNLASKERMEDERAKRHYSIGIKNIGCPVVAVECVGNRRI